MIIKLEIGNDKRTIEIDTGEYNSPDTDVKAVKDAVEQVRQLLIISNTI